MIRCLILAILTALCCSGDLRADEKRQLVLVIGAAGQDEYAEEFAGWSDQWVAAARKANFEVTTVAMPESGKTPLDRLRQRLQDTSAPEQAELWLVLIGHGTFDGVDAKFNLVGPDVSAAQLKEWLKPRTARTIIVNCSSASGPFVGELTGENRIVVTATKSGYESSYARFGQYLAEAIGEPANDLDKDRQTSLLEAFVIAAGKTAEFYSAETRLATEHAMIEDNGDGLGTPGEWFRGIRVTQVAKDGTPPDGLRANQVFFIRNESAARLTDVQVTRRDQLEAELEALRAKKSRFTEDQYYEQLERIMLQLARLYQTEAEPDR